MTMPERFVLLHGFTGHPSSWDRVVARLPSSARVFRPALIGHDRAAIEPRAFDEEVDRIAHAICAERMEGARLAGYSMGARVALGLAVRHSALFTGAVLFGAHAGLADPIERASRIAMEDEWCAILERDGIEPFVDAWELLPIFETQRTLAPEIRAAHRARRLAHDAVGLACAIRTLGLGRMPALEAELASLALPVRLVAGDRDRKFVALAHALASKLRRAEIRLVRGCGHDPLVEDPAAAAAALTEPLPPEGTQP